MISHFLSKIKIASVIGRMGDFSFILQLNNLTNSSIEAVLNIMAIKRNFQIFGHRS
jgi:hypothetical protein